MPKIKPAPSVGRRSAMMPLCLPNRIPARDPETGQLGSYRAGPAQRRAELQVCRRLFERRLTMLVFVCVFCDFCVRITDGWLREESQGLFSVRAGFEMHTPLQTPMCLGGAWMGMALTVCSTALSCVCLRERRGTQTAIPPELPGRQVIQRPHAALMGRAVAPAEAREGRHLSIYATKYKLTPGMAHRSAKQLRKEASCGLYTDQASARDQMEWKPEGMRDEGRDRERGDGF